MDKYSASNIESTTQLEVADIFTLYEEDYRQKYRLEGHHAKVFYDIEHCRDGSFGYRVDKCENCNSIQVLNNSCKNRHCPKCNGISRRRWVNKRMEDLLPVPYYHVVFTLPKEILNLAASNIETIYNVLFKASSETISDFASNPNWIGGKIGFYGILHTWGGQLWQHFHVHYIVPSAGINSHGKLVQLKYKEKFLFPVKAMSAPYRQKFIEALTQELKKGNLNLPENLKQYSNPVEFQKWMHHTFPPRWVVFAKSPFAGPAKVLKYIGMYSHRVAISNHRLIKLKNGLVHFKYKFDNKKQKKIEWRETRLNPVEFIRRFLLHVVPKNFHRIRHFGLFSNGKCKANISKIRSLLSENNELNKDKKSEKLHIGKICPVCKSGRLIHIFISLPGKVIWFTTLEKHNLKAVYDTA